MSTIEMLLAKDTLISGARAEAVANIAMGFTEIIQKVVNCLDTENLTARGHATESLLHVENQLQVSCER